MNESTSGFAQYHTSGGSRISRRGGHGLPRRLRFIKFVCQNERFGSLRGARAGGAPLNPPMHTDATCINTFESFTCECKAGYIRDGMTCLIGNICTVRYSYQNLCILYFYGLKLN